MQWNRHFISLPWSRKNQLRHWLELGRQKTLTWHHKSMKHRCPTNSKITLPEHPTCDNLFKTSFVWKAWRPDSSFSMASVKCNSRAVPSHVPNKCRGPRCQQHRREQSYTEGAQCMQIHGNCICPPAFISVFAVQHHTSIAKYIVNHKKMTGTG